MDLDGTRALVTGSARRVGRRIALRLARGGADVAVHYRTSAGEAEETVADLRAEGVEAVGVQGDLRDLDDVERIVGEAADALGGLDVAVNNASVFPRTPLDDVDGDVWDLNMDVNLRAPAFVAMAAAERMDSSTGPDGAPTGGLDGKIVNIADWAGFRPYENYLPYCVSKAGVIALTKGLARELAPDVAVNAVAPGPVMLPEDFSEDDRRAIVEQTPLNRIGSPDDIAAGIAFLVEGSDFMTGAVVPIDGGRLIA
jgi:NAD(P)-dependent dehydrogenase (short-subunit alcohol dehydrogenase family)